MRVQNVSVDRIGTNSRLSADLVFETPEVGTQHVWCEVPVEFESLWDTSGYCFYTAGLLAAMRFGESIQFDIPISQEEAFNLDTLQRSYALWYPNHLQSIEMKWTLREPALVPRRKKRGIFFSSGLDALHTVYCVKNRSGYRYDDDEIYLVPVTGFDMYPWQEGLIPVLHKNAETLAAHYGWKWLPLTTNVRYDFLTACANRGDREGYIWGKLCGSGHSIVVNALAGGFDAMYLGSSWRSDLGFLASTSLTLDHFWASEKTRLHHTGSECFRIEKIRGLAREPELLKLMRCCYESSDPNMPNCGHCGKCVHTLAALETCDLRQYTENVFPDTSYLELCELVSKQRPIKKSLPGWRYMLCESLKQPSKAELADAMIEAIIAVTNPELSFRY